MALPDPHASDEAEPSGKSATLLEPADYGQFLLHNRNEILYVLRTLLAGTDNITIYFNEGRDFLLSAVIGIDEHGLTLDYGSSSEMNQRALEADKHFCVTSHDKIRIQFLLRNLRLVTYQGGPAFRAALPDTVLRLQRREFYRLTTPIVNPVKCQIPTDAQGHVLPALVDANVIDISGGGLAFVVPPKDLVLETGTNFADCRVQLPEVGVLITTLEVRNVFDITLRSGLQVTRAGCQFSSLPGPMLTLVQRYIIKVERERKARASGMA